MAYADAAADVTVEALLFLDGEERLALLECVWFGDERGVLPPLGSWVREVQTDGMPGPPADAPS